MPHGPRPSYRQEQRRAARRCAEGARLLSHGVTVAQHHKDDALGGVTPTLMPLVRRQFISRGRRQYVTLGDREIEIGQTFKLFLHTNLSNPRFAPEVQAELIIPIPHDVAGKQDAYRFTPWGSVAGESTTSL